MLSSQKQHPNDKMKRDTTYSEKFLTLPGVYVPFKFSEVINYEDILRYIDVNLFKAIIYAGRKR
jgi:hypothetical protein